MDSDCWQEHAVNVTLDSMEGALNWIWDLKTTVPRSETCTVEGVLKALADQHVRNLCRSCSLRGHIYNGRKWGIAEPLSPPLRSVLLLLLDSRLHQARKPTPTLSHSQCSI